VPFAQLLILHQNMQRVRNMQQRMSVRLTYCVEYAPDQRMPLVGGFVMLRLVNPSLLTPVNAMLTVRACHA
jgi:hypothetical protein